MHLTFFSLFTTFSNFLSILHIKLSYVYYSLQRRRERYLLIHMWKILNDCSRNDIDIKFCDPSRKGVRAKVPSLRKSSSFRNQSLYDHSFAVQGPRLWNTIPAHLNQLTEPATFKSALTKYLLTIPNSRYTSCCWIC